MVVVAGAAQLPELLAVETAAFLGKEQWSEQLWREELAARGLVVLARTPSDTPAALAAFRVVGDTAELFRVASVPAERRLGYATRCITAGINWARGMESTEVLLEVRADNDAALALYDRFGFVVIDERKGYYQGVDALVMRLSLAEEGDDDE